jgi:hypothetical protein
MGSSAALLPTIGARESLRHVLRSRRQDVQAAARAEVYTAALPPSLITTLITLMRCYPPPPLPSRPYRHDGHAIALRSLFTLLG